MVLHVHRCILHRDVCATQGNWGLQQVGSRGEECPVLIRKEEGCEVMGMDERAGDSREIRTLTWKPRRTVRSWWGWHWPSGRSERASTRPTPWKFRAGKFPEFPRNVEFLSTRAPQASPAPCVNVQECVCHGREEESRAHLVQKPCICWFLHSSPPVEGPDSGKDLETTYLEQVVAKPVFISFSVFLKYHTSVVFSVILSSYF